MVDTCRWPKALYNALSTSRELMPRRAALSLSTATKVSTPFSCWSVSTSVRAGCSRIWSASCVAQLARSLVESLFSVYWYVELVCRPPPRRSCTGFKNKRMPVTCANCGRNRAITAWPDSERWSAGLRLMNMKPPPARPPPVKPTTVSTAGSFLMMSTSCCSLPLTA